MIKHYNKLISTNLEALENFEEFEDGNVIVADVQTHGRGRFDRVWESSSVENIYMSFVIKPENTINFPFMNLTQYLSVVVNRVFNRDYGIKSNLKWPNDILFENKKLCGILAESKMGNNNLVGVALGIGINVNADMKVFENLPQATAICDILGEQVDKNLLTEKIVAEFYKGYNCFVQKGFSSIIDEYRQMCRFSNGMVKVSASPNAGEYIFDSINPDGTLTVLDKENRKISIITGDIVC